MAHSGNRVFLSSDLAIPVAGALREGDGSQRLTVKMGEEHVIFE
jgi:hypothetical protein